ncbi:cell division protein ZapD [Tatumella terrea]|uniref:cell division protein ZapD n=1 Tax=Tatumella terrea TaxID=419007 RepID=UPI0031D08874
MSTVILFEYPLNEKMRTWLRIEYLLKNLSSSQPVNDPASALSFFRGIGDLLDIFDRGDFRADLVKELDRQQQKLCGWLSVSGVDTVRVSELQQELKQQGIRMMAVPRMGQQLREDRFISQVRQRLGIPGGCCSFDLPSLHIWLNSPETERQAQVDEWCSTLQPLKESLSLVLDLIRQSGSFHTQTSLNGFFQDNAEDADLLRLKLNADDDLYPQISGHKNRYAIRFMPADSEQGEIPARLQFELACC